MSTRRPESGSLWSVETPSAELQGARIVTELPGEIALPAWMTYRAVMLYATERMSNPAAVGLPFDRDAISELMYQLLETSTANPESSAKYLAAILVELISPNPVLRRLALGCLCVTEWAIGGATPKSYIGTALAFADAAAWVSNSARFWFLTGKLHRSYGEHVRAEFFLMQATKLARGQGDTETSVRIRLSYGNSLLSRGDFEGAKHEFEQALRACVVNRMRGVVEAEVHHDLMIVRTALGDYEGALREAERAVQGYTGAQHHRTPFLVHDLAWLWIAMRDYSNALALLTNLLVTEPSFRAPLSRLMVTANVLWAAAGAGAVEAYREFAVEFDSLLAETLTSGVTNKHAPAALAAARGASIVTDQERFHRWITVAQQLAEQLGQDDVLTDAADLLNRRSTLRSQLRTPVRHTKLATKALRIMAPS